MTASSFYQVPLIGGFNNATTTTTRPTPPLVQRVNGIRKNLFGSPEPGEIAQKFNSETKKYLQRFKEVHNFDLKNSEKIPLPDLIQQEQEAYEQKLKLLKESNNNNNNNNSNSSANINHNNNNNNKIQTQYLASSKRSIKLIENHEDSQQHQHQHQHHHHQQQQQQQQQTQRKKPYERQRLITEVYPKRKITSLNEAPTSGVVLFCQVLEDRRTLSDDEEEISLRSTSASSIIVAKTSENISSQ